MKKTSSVLPILVGTLAIVFFMTQNASALPMTVGDPVEGNSWYQGFNESGVGYFDTVETFMITPPGVDFEDPGFSAFSNGSWSGELVNPDYALGTGDAVTSLTWNIIFAPDKTEPFTFHFLAWEGGVMGTLKEAASATWTGSGWSIVGMTTDGSGYNRASIPDASTLLLLGSAMLGFGLIRRKS